MGVRIAAKEEFSRLIWVLFGNQPDPANATTHAVFVGAFTLIEWRECARELDHIRNALLPVGEGRKFVCEIFGRLIDAGHKLSDAPCGASEQDQSRPP